MFFLISMKGRGSFSLKVSFRQVESGGLFLHVCGFCACTCVFAHVQQMDRRQREEKRAGGKVDPKYELYPY